MTERVPIETDVFGVLVHLVGVSRRRLLLVLLVLIPGAPAAVAAAATALGQVGT